jgi:hypothetical protein
LAARDSLSLTLEVPTLGLGGDNTLSVQVNPQLLPEQVFSNNTWEAAFRVTPDRTAPLLDVTFDGRYLTDGEVISAKPNIVVRLQDDNTALALRDTNYVSLWWQNCEKCTPVKVSYRQRSVQWQSPETNRMEVSYRPSNLAAGLYRLAVQGRDVVGNSSGVLPYSVSFRVVENDAIERFDFGPNPANGFGKFQISLAGREAPDAYNLRIFNQLGQMIQDITERNQPLHIGLNEVWLGTYALPLGTYFYQLEVKKAGKLWPFAPGVMSQGKMLWWK